MCRGSYEERYYLVDSTYRQFFTYANTFLERIGLEYSFGPSIGAYMIMSEERKRIASELLVNGFIELDLEIIKTYLSSFIFSGRNSEYNWIMSPIGFDFGGSAYVWSINGSGWLWVNNDKYKPVVSLKSNITMTGTGTELDPYVVE